MDIFFCADYKAQRGLGLAILSLAKHNRNFNIHIVTAEFGHNRVYYEAVSRDFVDKLGFALRDKGISIYLYDITEEFLTEPPLANLDTRFTPFCMLRLYIDVLLNREKLDIDRLLYLDCDVICRGDITSLFETDLSGAELAGVSDYYGSRAFIRRYGRKKYINSGILLINVPFMKAKKTLERARRLCTEKTMFLPDQTALNLCAQNKLVLPRKYNEQRKLKTDTVFQHFTTSFRVWPYPRSVSVKPWEYERVHKVLKIYDYDDLYEEFEEIF